jgi:hypothetical protein
MYQAGDLVEPRNPEELVGVWQGNVVRSFDVGSQEYVVVENTSGSVGIFKPEELVNVDRVEFEEFMDDYRRDTYEEYERDDYDE